MAEQAKEKKEQTRPLEVSSVRMFPDFGRTDHRRAAAVFSSAFERQSGGDKSAGSGLRHLRCKDHRFPAQDYGDGADTRLHRIGHADGKSGIFRGKAVSGQRYSGKAGAILR